MMYLQHGIYDIPIILAIFMGNNENKPVWNWWYGEPNNLVYTTHKNKWENMDDQRNLSTWKCHSSYKQIHKSYLKRLPDVEWEMCPGHPICPDHRALVSFTDSQVGIHGVRGHKTKIVAVDSP